jgi:hypothetical protein
MAMGTPLQWFKQVASPGEEVTVGSDPGTPVTDEYPMLTKDAMPKRSWDLTPRSPRRFAR